MQLVVHFCLDIFGIVQHPYCKKMHSQLISKATAEHNVQALVQTKVVSWLPGMFSAFFSPLPFLLMLQ